MQVETGSQSTRQHEIKGGKKAEKLLNYRPTRSNKSNATEISIISIQSKNAFERERKRERKKKTR